MRSLIPASGKKLEYKQQHTKRIIARFEVRDTAHQDGVSHHTSLVVERGDPKDIAFASPKTTSNQCADYTYPAVVISSVLSAVRETHFLVFRVSRLVFKRRFQKEALSMKNDSTSFTN